MDAKNMKLISSTVERFKMKEHAAWYGGEIDILVNFYTLFDAINAFGLVHSVGRKARFWGRAHKNDASSIIHVPIATDIADTSAGFLFGETPVIKFSQYNAESTELVNDQKELGLMLDRSGFYESIVQGADIASGLGGVFLKLAWDSELSDYPIVVVEQPDDAEATFKFGMLESVRFYKTLESPAGDKAVYRTIEEYSKGAIETALFKGTDKKLGENVPLTTLESTKEVPEKVETPDVLLAVYIPNMLPNRLCRTSCLGRSDYAGQEIMMDKLDETFSAWMNDVRIARGRLLVSEDMFKSSGDKEEFDYEEGVYKKLDIDPQADADLITVVQFDLRAEQFEKTTLNLMDRIITSAGYSPQSFGLNIQGRAESGTALNVRERKSFITNSKKQSYWEKPLKHLVKAMCMLYTEEMGGKISCEFDVDVEFKDSVSNNMTETATCVKMLADAIAASTDTKVRMAHPEWSDEQVKKEVELILNESAPAPMETPEESLDIEQLKKAAETGKPIGEAEDAGKKTFFQKQ
jgi:A118 family predicted phage portal protein